MSVPVVMETNLPFPKKKGKVRDVYDLGKYVLLITTDRVSAFDRVMPNGVPLKGVVLQSMTLFWYRRCLSFTCRCAYDTANLDKIIEKIPEAADAIDANRDILRGRTMLAYKFDSVPIECIARGFLSGSAWKDYQRTGEVCGIKLPKGLQENAPLPKVIFTPATKAETGHDQNISFEEMVRIVGNKFVCENLRGKTIHIYKTAVNEAWKSGIMVADTKMEWGLFDGYDPILIDELLTPDSSRFWAVENYRVGGPVASYDKQYLRDWLESSGWDKESDPPMLPGEVIEKLSNKYLEAHKTLTGKDLIVR